MEQQNTPRTDQMRALLGVAAFGDTSTRFKAKRELIEALASSLGMPHWKAKRIVIGWISDHRREYPQLTAEPSQSPQLFKGDQDFRRPHVTVEWK